MMSAPLQWNALSHPRDTAVALGNFDGVHLGHRRALAALRSHAESRDLEPVALTFDPHPRHYFAVPEQCALLTLPGEKDALIASLGVTPVTLCFDAGLAAMTAERFIAEVLLDRLRGRAFFLGPNHRFGKNALGDADLLRRTTEIAPGKSPAGVHEVDPVIQDGDVVSSSAIRKLLGEGNVEGAARLLGRPYSLAGTVAGGSGRGRLLGFPTANLDLDPRKILPAFGVYGGIATLEGAPHPAVANLGMRPTFGGTAPSVEVHVLDWEGDLYGKPFEFGILRRLRPERRFPSPEALREQIRADVEEWRNFAKSGTPLFGRPIS